MIRSRLSRPRLSRPGLFAALLALAAQLAWGACVPSLLDALLAAEPICHAGAPAGQTHLPVSAVAPQCLAAALPAPLSVAPPVLPPPRAATGVAPFAGPIAAAPPAERRLAAAPRGPPAPVRT